MWRPAPRSLATCSWAAAPRCGTARSCEVGAGAGRTWVLGMSWMGGGIWRPKTGVGGLSCALFLGACSDHHRSCSLPPLPPPPPAGDVNSVVVGEKSSIQDYAIVHVARHNPAGKVRRPWELRRGAATMIAVMLPAARAGAPPRLLLICCPSHFRILSAVSRAAAALPRPAPPRPLQKLPTLIGSNVTIGQGAIIHGATIQDCVVVGMGATVMDGVTVRAPPACVEVTAAPHSVHMPPQLPGDMELCDACCDPDVQACCLSLTTLVLTLGVQPVPALCAGREPVGGGRGRAGAPGHAHPQRPGLGGQPRQVPAQPRGRWVPGVGGCRGWVPGVGAGGVGEPG